MKTYSAKPGEIARDWYVVDADGLTLGRLATQIADTLRGKRKPQYTPHVDTGDFVVVVNVAKLRVTGRKAERKVYYRHSGYPGGIKQDTFAKLHAEKPERVLKKAVKGMLPKGPLGYAMLSKLKLYAGATHPH
ncbi:MAG: 50S ribosomal protein L13, partial [Gaiellaceae bacterium]